MEFYPVHSLPEIQFEVWNHTELVKVPKTNHTLFLIAHDGYRLKKTNKWALVQFSLPQFPHPTWAFFGLRSEFSNKSGSSILFLHMTSVNYEKSLPQSLYHSSLSLLFSPLPFLQPISVFFGCSTNKKSASATKASPSLQLLVQCQAQEFLLSSPVSFSILLRQKLLEQAKWRFQSDTLKYRQYAVSDTI